MTIYNLKGTKHMFGWRITSRYDPNLKWRCADNGSDPSSRGSWVREERKDFSVFAPHLRVTYPLPWAGVWEPVWLHEYGSELFVHAFN